MINEAQVSLTGYVAREPKFRLTRNGVSMASVRVAYTPRRVDRETGEWADGASSFVTVICWRSLAVNVATCLRKGEPVLVKGRLQVRPYDKDGVSRLSVEVEASSIGHDLTRGVAYFQRVHRPSGATAFGAPAADDPRVPALPGAPGSPVGPAGPLGEAILDAMNGTGALDGAEAGPPPGDQVGNGAGLPAEGDDAALPGEDDADDGVTAPAGLTAPF